MAEEQQEANRKMAQQQAAENKKLLEEIQKQAATIQTLLQAHTVLKPLID